MRDLLNSLLDDALDALIGEALGEQEVRGVRMIKSYVAAKLNRVLIKSEQDDA